MKYNRHYINSISSKASHVHRLVKRNLRHCPKVVKERAYQFFVCPKLEYSSTIWNPQQVTQKRRIEQIQRNAARFVSNKPFNYQKPTYFTSMIQQLNWPTLEARHQSSDLVLMYKVVHNLVAVPIAYGPRCEKTCLWRFVKNTGADQPAHLRSLISALVICLLACVIYRLATGKFQFSSCLCS